MNVTNNHTPGPWHVLKTKSGFVVDVGDEPILECWFGISREGPEGNANANLAAAAPDLLDALTVALTILEGKNYGVEKHIRAAISKAMGES